jgi:hypothetical protein
MPIAMLCSSDYLFFERKIQDFAILYKQKGTRCLASDIGSHCEELVEDERNDGVLEM